MKKVFQYNLTYLNAVRWFLTGILILLPFQLMIAKTDFIMTRNLQNMIRFIDEITIVVFFPLSIIQILKNRKHHDCSYLLICIPIIMFSLSAFVSGIINGNSLVVTVLGIFDYLKYFLVIFIFAAFFNNFKDVKRSFNILLIGVFLLGATGLIQEMWATGSIYIIGKDITDKNIYIFTKLFFNTQDMQLHAFDVRWRFGLLRAESLVGQSTLLGFYCLLFFTIYIYSKKVLNWIVLLPILSGVLVSISRMTYAALAFICYAFIFKGRKYLLILLVPFLLIVTYIGFMSTDIDMPESHEQSYRSYARDKSLEIWQDHNLWGVGPGKYGGLISVKFPSHIYEEYNFLSKHLNNSLYKWKSLDQFWPQVLAETGLIGILFFIGIFVSILYLLFRLKYKVINYEQNGFLTGIIVFMVPIHFLLLGSALNITAVIYTYFAFVGTAMGCSFEQDEGENQ